MPDKYEIIQELPEGETFVAMLMYPVPNSDESTLIVASTKRLYMLTEEDPVSLKPIPIGLPI